MDMWKRINNLTGLFSSNTVYFCFKPNRVKCHEFENFHSKICGWCMNSLSFTQLYTNYHFCDDYIVWNYYKIIE